MTSVEPSEEALALAQRLMYELLGRRWTPITTATEVYNFDSDQSVISLDGQPVISVESVEWLDSGEPLEYAYRSGHRLVFSRPPVGGFTTWPASGRLPGPWCGTEKKKVRIQYTFGSALPEAAEQAMNLLAVEIQLGIDGDTECRLPERITSVSRQGISYTILDPLSYLDQGRTGIPEVDSVIRALNPSKARRQAKFYGRVARPSDRMSM